MKSIASQILKLTAQKGITSRSFWTNFKRINYRNCTSRSRKFKNSGRTRCWLADYFENRLGYAYTADLKKEPYKH